MRVIVDPEICQGHLRCYAVAPDLFEINDLGHAIAVDRELTEGPEAERARHAVETCPEQAIRMEP